MEIGETYPPACGVSRRPSVHRKPGPPARCRLANGHRLIVRKDQHRQSLCRKWAWRFQFSYISQGEHGTTDSSSQDQEAEPTQEANREIPVDGKGFGWTWCSTSNRRASGSNVDRRPVEALRGARMPPSAS